MVLSVAFINGWTDAPNSVAACVSTGVLQIKKALAISAIADFLGSIMIGLFSGKVSDKIIDLSSYCMERDNYLISVFSIMLSVLILAVVSRCFGLPTSESHAVLAGILGTTAYFNNGLKNLNDEVWSDVGAGLILSVLIGYVMSYLFMKSMVFFIKKNKLTLEYKNIQIISSIFTSFFHGAQDSQKFVAIAMSVLNSNENKINNLELKVTFLIAVIISIGILTSGEKIINTIGHDLVKLNNLQGFSADVSGIICILIFTLFGYPLSTTHVKTSAIIGAGSVEGKLNRKIASELIASWIVTFPFCAVLSYTIAWILTK